MTTSLKSLLAERRAKAMGFACSVRQDLPGKPGWWWSEYVPMTESAPILAYVDLLEKVIEFLSGKLTEISADFGTDFADGHCIDAKDAVAEVRRMIEKE